MKVAFLTVDAWKIERADRKTSYYPSRFSAEAAAIMYRKRDGILHKIQKIKMQIKAEDYFRGRPS